MGKGLWAEVAIWDLFSFSLVLKSEERSVYNMTDKTFFYGI